MKKHIITKEEYEAAKKMAKRNRHKRVDKRLQVIILRYEGASDAEIAVKTQFKRKYVSKLCADFKRMGPEEYARHKYGSNCRNMSVREEAEFFRQFEEKAAKGQVLTVAEISKAYFEKLGKKPNNGIYRVLHRQGWRNIMPRSKHPKKASDEEIESSKKLTQPTKI